MSAPLDDQRVPSAHQQRMQAKLHSPVTPLHQGPQTGTPDLSGSTLAPDRHERAVVQGSRHKGYDFKPASDACASNYSAPWNGAYNVPTRPARQVRRQESPLKGYGRVARASKHDSGWPLAVEMKTQAPIKSPLWEPKLTPRREGDDLYLAVSAATPQHANFPATAK